AAGRPPGRPDHGREHARGGLLLHRDPPARDGRGEARRERGEDRLVSGAPHPAAAGGAQAEETALRDAQRAETDRLLATRLDLTAVLFLVFVGGSVVIEATQVPARARALWLIYGLEALVCLLRSRTWPATRSNSRRPGAWT